MREDLGRNLMYLPSIRRKKKKRDKGSDGGGRASGETLPRRIWCSLSWAGLGWAVGAWTVTRKQRWAAVYCGRHSKTGAPHGGNEGREMTGKQTIGDRQIEESKNKILNLWSASRMTHPYSFGVVASSPVERSPLSLSLRATFDVSLSRLRVTSSLQSGLDCWAEGTRLGRAVARCFFFFFLK